MAFIFDYPNTAHVRRHGPYGYTNYKSYKPWLRDEFTFRCAYCLTRETWCPGMEGDFSVDHFIPQATAQGKNLILDYDNMIYACCRCNSSKSDDEVIDPCVEAMSSHLVIHKTGEIEGLTPEGIDYIEILGLDDPELVIFRKKMIDTIERLQELKDDRSKEILKQWVGFPARLPNLSVLKPRGGNNRKGGLSNSYFKQFKEGSLPEKY